MLAIRQLSMARLQAYMAKCAALPLTYPEVGATDAKLPSGYSVYQSRSELGRGNRCFQLARQALDRWTQLRLGWLDVLPHDAPIQPGEVVAVGARLFGVWSFNVCRIIYVVDEAGPVARYGFAYGTLPDHMAVGEERFLVEWNSADDVVWFGISVFSRPRHWLARLGYPALAYVQRRFRREAPEAMRCAVASAYPNSR